jgi:ABC-type sulfate/molybdate transport systems ATPase subunit
MSPVEATTHRTHERLDPPARARMIRLVKEIRDSGQAQIVLSSHLLRDVEECCDEALVLKDGRIAFHGNLEEERRLNKKFLQVETRGDERAFAAAAEALGCTCALLGQGRLTPNYNNTRLQIGKTNTMSATAASGFTFDKWIVATNWSDGAVVRNRKLTFVMEPNLTITAVFLDTKPPRERRVCCGDRCRAVHVSWKGWIGRCCGKWY